MIRLSTAAPRSRRPRLLLVEERNWDHYEGLGLVVMFLGGAVLTALMVATLGQWTPLQRLVIAVPVVGLIGGPAIVFYPMMAMRGAVWDDGFRPSSTFTSLGATDFLRRGMRGKFRWGEVSRLVVRYNPESGALTTMNLLISGSIEFKLGIGGRHSASANEYVLLILERWRALGGDVVVDGGSDAGEPTAAAPAPTAPSWNAYAGSDVLAWIRHEEKARHARRAFAQAACDIHERGYDGLTVELEATTATESRYRLFKKLERELRKRLEAEMAAPAASYREATSAGLGAYRAAMPAPPVGPRPLWMPPPEAMPDEGAANRRADELVWNGRWIVVGCALIAAVCAGPATAAALAGDWPRVGLWGLFGAICTAPIPFQLHLSAEEDTIIVLFPRNPKHQRVALAPGQGVFNNPFRYRAVRFHLLVLYCHLDAPATTKDGKPWHVLGLLAIERLRDGASLGRSVDFFLGEDSYVLSKRLDGVVLHHATAAIGLLTEAQLVAMTARDIDERLRGGLYELLGTHGLRVQEGGAIMAVPKAVMDVYGTEIERAKTQGIDSKDPEARARLKGEIAAAVESAKTGMARES